MPAQTSYIPRQGGGDKWGKASKGFAVYLQLAGKTIGKEAAKALADAGEEFMLNEDWDWPRGERYDTTHHGRSVRAASPYASGFRGGDAMHPWYSGNTHDSIAVGVIQGTRILASRHMRPGAAEDQTYNGMTIDGVTAGEDALRRAAYTFAEGTKGNTLRAVMVIGVPYAEKLNTADSIGFKGHEVPNTHVGYADYLQHEFYTTILPKVQDLWKIKVRMK